MTGRAPSLIFLSDQLEAPPRLGYHVHLLGLAGAAARHLPTAAFCWADPAAPHPAHVVPVDPAAAPRGGFARKRHYVQRALAWIRERAAPGSVLWVRDSTTALLLRPALGRAARRRLGLTLLYDVSSLVRIERREAGDRLGPLRGFLEERAWAGADRLRTLNDPMADYLAARGVPREKIWVLPVGCAAAAAQWRPRDGGRRVLYVGSAMAWQGLPELFAAMRLLAERDPAVRLTVLGAGREAVDADAVPPSVDLVGRVPHAAVAAAYLEHDLFVLPRPRTPLTELVSPMKIPEAMAHGVPIVASDLPAVRWMTGADGALLVPPGDAAALAAAIAELLDDPARRQALGARARARSAAFTWERIGERIAAELFGSGVGAAGAGARPAQA